MLQVDLNVPRALASLLGKARRVTNQTMKVRGQYANGLQAVLQADPADRVLVGRGLNWMIWEPCRPLWKASRALPGPDNGGPNPYLFLRGISFRRLINTCFCTH